MLNKILNFALSNRLIILLMSVVLLSVGTYIAREMNVDVLPDLTAPSVTLLTEAHGMESQEVEKLVTYPLETAMNGSPGVRRIRSASASGISIVWIEFEWGTDVYRARQIVSERVPMVRSQLPEGVGEPTMAPISSIMGEVMMLAVHSDSLPPMELRTLSDWTIRPLIKSIPGVANVFVMGGEYKQYQIHLNPQKLHHYGLGVEEVFNKVKEANMNASGGFFNEYGNQYYVKGNGRVNTIADLEQALVRSVDGQVIRLKDVANVSVGGSDKIGDGSMNASPAVVLTISKQPSTNTLELTKRLDEKVEELQQTLPKGVTISNQIFRQADFIEGSISNLNQTLLEGAFFVAIVLFLFLMNWRTTLISLVAIPISLLASVIVLKLMGGTINTMSLGGMAIAIGALVDDAIIDVENVYKRLRENIRLPRDQRRSIIEVVRMASMEIRSSIIIATFIIIVSFIPLFFLGGMEGRLLQPLGVAFITSVLASLVVAVTLTPVLCSYLLDHEKLLNKQAEGSGLERWLQSRYEQALKKVLHRPKTTIGLTVLLFVLSLGIFTQLGRDFLPAFNEGSVVVSIVGPPSMSLKESNKIGTLAEELLLELDEIHLVTRRTGRAELDEHAQGVNSSEIVVPFQLENKSKDEFFNEIREKLAILPGVNVSLGQPIAHRIDHMLSGTQANIAIKIFGSDLEKLFELGNQIKSLLQGVDGLDDVIMEQQITVPQIRINPRREILAAYGMTVTDLMHQVDIALAGEKAGDVYEGQRYFDIVVRYGKEFRGGIDKIRNTLISLPDGGSIVLHQLADVSSLSSPNTINREEVQRKIAVGVNISGRDLRGAVAEIKGILDEGLDLPIGYRVVYGGQFESEAAASKMLMSTALLAIAIILLLLYAEFREWKLALVVLLNLPLGLIGGILIVYFTSGVISIAATIGFISLFGIATRNGILLVSRYEDLLAEGKNGWELLVSGAKDRLNPILMTAFTTGLALIPLAFNGEVAGNEIQSPMAIVILGGLFTATLLNLFVIPCVYLLLRKIGH